MKTSGETASKPWRDIRDDVWCLTCEHAHIATIPVTTYACSDCGFGAWATVMAVSHASQHVDHAVYVVHHQTVPILGGWDR